MLPFGFIFIKRPLLVLVFKKEAYWLWNLFSIADSFTKQVSMDFFIIQRLMLLVFHYWCEDHSYLNLIHSPIFI
jgi:hypothetical protein